uniref:Interferon-induced very large GTPase 1-like n=1 Tax=Catagonus wagneri TaxID=51154 RepID=A0A8C3W1Q5_9CETA
MNIAESTTDESLLRGKKWQNLQEMLQETGLEIDYWLPKLQENLGVTSAQALQHLEEKDLQKLKSQARHPWEKRALEKLLNLSPSNRLSELQEHNRNWRKAVRKKEAELSQAVEIPKELWPPSENSLREVVENMKRQLSLMQETLSPRKILADRELLRWASGGLALQGIYKTSNQKDLIAKREELLSVPKEFSFCGPEQGTRMETKKFASSQAESMFTQMIEKLGFSATASAKGGGWGFSLETSMDHRKHSESEETHKSHAEHTYFCSTKLSYIPLVSCYFSKDQLHFSKAALQELKCMEGLLHQPEDPDRLPLLRRRTEDFFHRFGSHANQGPLHLGGIYWWKAVSEGFQR